VIFITTVSVVHGQTGFLTISENKRYIVKENGEPFFWLGDTAWELFHRSDKEEAAKYLKNRAAKGFTVIQAVVLAEFNGLSIPNAYGDIPLINNDPTKPNEKYFEHVDFIVNKAEELGLFIGMLPTWGDKFNKRWGIGPEIFTGKNAETYGKYLGNRYKEKPIIWILGGDRIPEEDEDFEIINAMAEGLKKGDTGNHLITYHPMGEHSSSEFFHGADWLDLNMFQSGHGTLNNQSYKWVIKDYNTNPVKPVLNGEPCYEDHPIGWNPENGWFDDFDSRRDGYWCMLSGACGHTYGNHNIWQMLQKGYDPVSSARTPWNQALDYPGAFQAGYMKRLFESRPWQLLKPNQSIILKGPNEAGREIIAASASDSTFLMAYTPFGSNFSLSLTLIKGDSIKAWWFNPRNSTSIFINQMDKNSDMEFDPPFDEKLGNDWVLIIDKANSGYLNISEMSK